jgi:MFS family permease
MLLARVVQGFAASGEFASATAMLVELAPRRRRSFYASTQMASQVVTVALASAVILLLSAYMTPAALEGWGWRSVFAVGTLIGPLGFYMRVRMAESPEFLAVAQRRDPATRTPLSQALRHYPRELLCMAGLVVIGSASFYLILIFMPLYAAQELGISLADAQIATILSALVQSAVILWAGALADRFGRLQILLPAALAYTVLSYPLFSYLIAHPSFATLLRVQLTASIILGFLSGPLPAAISELLPAEVRSSGIGIIYNVVGAIFGGLGPFLITVTIGLTGDKAGPAYWAVFTGAIGAIAVLALHFRRAPTLQRSR